MTSVPNDDADSDDERLVKEDGCCTSVETKKITYMRSMIKNEAPAKAR